MFCGKCGKEIKGGTAFCPFCGASVANSVPNIDSEATVSDVSANDIVIESIEPVPVMEESNADQETTLLSGVEPVSKPEEPKFAQVQFDAPVNVPKKTSKKWKVLGGLAIVAILIALNFNSIVGFLVKTFGSDATYFKYVESQAIGRATEGIGKSFKNAEKKGAIEGSYEIQVGKDLISALEEETDDEYEFDWLNEIVFNYALNSKDQTTQMQVGMELEKKELVDAEMIMDMEEQEMFVGVLNLSDEYLSVPLDDSGMEEMMELLEDEEFKKALPSERALKKMLKKYIKIVAANMTDVKASNKTITVDGISQKVTVLEFELDSDTAKKMVIDVFEAMQKDKALKKYIEDISKVLEDHDLIEDSDDVYDDFMDALDEAIDEIEDDDSDNETLFELTDFVNSKHEIVGRKLEVEEEEVLYYVTVQKGKKTATEMEIAQELILEGKGTNKRGVISGEYDIKLDSEDMKIGTIVLEKYNTKKARKGYLSGTFRFEPSSALLEEMDLDSLDSSVISIADPEIEIVFDGGKNKGEVEVNLINDKELLVGVKTKAKLKKASRIKLPASKHVIDVDDVDEWIETLDFDKLIKTLEKTSLPDEAVEELEDAIDSYM